MSPIPGVVVELLCLLDSLGIGYAVCGSFASSAWGEPRQTRDLDLNLILTGDQAERLASALPKTLTARPPKSRLL